MKIEKFYIAEDHRFEQRNLGSLASSIHRIGLQQPIIVERDEDGNFKIKGGRRRFRALTEYLGWTELKKGTHYIETEAKNLSDALVVQYEENNEREDFSPVELAFLIKDIHKEKVNEHGKAITGISGKGWTQGDTAKILGKDISYVSRMLKISESPDEVKDCKTVKDALERLDKKRQRHIETEVQKARVEKSSKRVDNLDFQDWLKNLHNAKVEDFLPNLPDKSVDLVYTDPPYGIDLNATTDTEAYECYDDVPEDIEKLVLWCINEYYRVLKDDTFCVIWTSNQLFRPLYDRAKEIGFGVGPTPLYWIKTGHSGKAKNPEKTLGSAAEIALYCWKGDPVLRKQGGQNVFPFPTVRKNRIHIAQKPESLICAHLEIFSDPGHLVLDTFSGSGAIMRGTILSKRLFKGCEKDEANYYSSLTYTQEYFEGKENDIDET